MKPISNNIFTSRFPHLDIHGETRESIEVIINGFIKDNIKLRYKNIVIVHGKGSGTLRRKTHEILKKHTKVNNFNLDMFNVGCTIVELIIDKK